METIKVDNIMDIYKISASFNPSEKVKIDLEDYKNNAISHIYVYFSYDVKIEVNYKNNKMSTWKHFNQNDIKDAISFIENKIKKYNLEFNEKKWYNNIKKSDTIVEVKQGWWINKKVIAKYKKRYYNDISDQNIYHYLEDIRDELQAYFIGWGKEYILYKVYSLKSSYFKENVIDQKDLYEKYNLNELVNDNTLYYVKEYKKGDIVLLVSIYIEECAEKSEDRDFLEWIIEIKQIS